MVQKAEAEASYRKTDGRITVSSNFEWTPSKPDKAKVEIAFPNITNLQQTPASHPTVMMKIFSTGASNDEPVVHKFTFIARQNARVQCDTIAAALKEAISASKAKTVPVKASDSQLSVPSLVADIELQQSLLKNDPFLSETFRASVVNGSLSNEQFWLARVTRLRNHSIEKNQQKGPYNVLAAIRPRTVNNKIKVSLTREQISDLFDQIPLVKEVYNQCVPPLMEGDFWGRFFMSRLCKKLRGERIAASDPHDDMLDKFLEQDSSKRNRADDEDVPLIIDLEGNEQNVSKKFGNRPDFTMRPDENVPVIQSLNQISQQMLRSIGAPQDKRSRADEISYVADGRLHDLEGDKENKKVLLNIRDQQDFFSGKEHTTTIKNTRDLELMAHNVEQHLGGDLDLRKRSVSPHSTGNHADFITPYLTGQYAQQKRNDLSNAVIQQITMCHSVANEFLRQFWMNFLSGDKRKIKNIENMAKYLMKTSTRIEAIAHTAAVEGCDPDLVHEVMSPTVKAVNKALEQYRKAYESARSGSVD